VGQTIVRDVANGRSRAVILYGTLIMDATGNLYGTTSGGGASGFGVVFRVDATRPETKLNLKDHKQIGVALTSAISRNCPSLHSFRKLAFF